MTRDTVMSETPALRATSFIVAGMKQASSLDRPGASRPRIRAANHHLNVADERRISSRRDNRTILSSTAIAATPFEYTYPISTLLPDHPQTTDTHAVKTH